MSVSKSIELNRENCFICGEKAIETCKLCDSGVAYCGERHKKIHRKEVCVTCTCIIIYTCIDELIYVITLI